MRVIRTVKAAKTTKATPRNLSNTFCNRKKIKVYHNHRLDIHAIEAFNFTKGRYVVDLMKKAQLRMRNQTPVQVTQPLASFLLSCKTL